MSIQSIKILYSLLGLVLLQFGCSVAQQTYIHPHFTTHDRQQTVRVVLYVKQEAAHDQSQTKFHLQKPSLSPKVLAMWALMAQKYLNDKRDYFITQRFVIKDLKEIQCQAPVQGYWMISGRYHQEDGPQTAVQLKLDIRLKRCDHIQVWAGKVAGEWPAKDDVLVDLRKDYIQTFGSEVTDFAVASFYALQQVLRLTPRPKLNEANTEAKIMWEDEQ
jgi:probable lipoprotein (TIGR04455 family)